MLNTFSEKVIFAVSVLVSASALTVVLELTKLSQWTTAPGRAGCTTAAHHPSSAPSTSTPQPPSAVERDSPGGGSGGGGGTGGGDHRRPPYRVVATVLQGWKLTPPGSGGGVGGGEAGGPSVEPPKICACAKCGSASMFHDLYETVFGRSYDFQGRPWVQMLDSPRWERRGRRDSLRTVPANASFALVRDPRDRIMSAYRSKVRCDGDVDDTVHPFASELLDLAGLPEEGRAIDRGGRKCLNESTYLGALSRIHGSGLEGMLNAHFRPQHLHCFVHVPPSEWTFVSTVGSPTARCDLESVVRRGGAAAGPPSSPNVTAGGRADRDCPFRMSHSTSGGNSLNEMPEAHRAILDEITRDEYDVLGPYLD